MATIKDIAQATGVSAMTVSRYFNEPDKLKPKTFDKIKAAVEEMGYQPNMVARLLVTKKTNIICVYIAGDIDALHPFTLQAIAGIGERLGENGYSMLLSRDGYEKHNCDGIIAMGLSIEQEKELMQHSNEKAIILFGNSSHNSNWVDINNYQGTYMATKYMIERGYTKIGYIGIDNEMEYSLERHQGYLDCMEEFNMQIPQNAEVKVPNHEDDGYQITSEIWEKTTVDALVCASDALALGVMRYANEKDIDVPNDLGVIGFDGLGYEKLVTPNLTTIQQPVYEAGMALAERMVEVLKSGEYSGTEMFIEPILRVNGSTK
ncbi:MAG: LacI family transcriptional regulator [Eubacterium sp.]|nr:LacI family transcriptional regulator [Eubacterium sp.]